jgi:hypothetical protein
MFFPPLRREVSRVVPSRHPPFGCSNKNEIIGLSFPGHAEFPGTNLPFQLDAARSRNPTPRLQVCRSLLRRGKKWTSSCSSHCSCFCSPGCPPGRIAPRAGRGFMVPRPPGVLDLPSPRFQGDSTMRFSPGFRAALVALFALTGAGTSSAAHADSGSIQLWS